MNRNQRAKYEVFNKDSKIKNISSYFILHQIDGHLSYNLKIESSDDIPEKETKTVASIPIYSSDSNRIQIIGYEDVKEDILEQIEPILNPNDAVEWGLQKPGGILLYGPPGCGKTYWANWIAEFLKYKFKEVPRSMFGSTYVDGAMNNLKKLLDEIKKQPKSILFFDEFDSVASFRSQAGTSSNENSKVVNTLLQEIPKLIEKDILIIAATNFIDTLDPAVIRPGRFDLKLPIFPPTIEERGKLLFFLLKKDLKQDSTLIKILNYNNADNAEFWSQFAPQMLLFSNSLIKDLANLIKMRLKKIYKESNNHEIKFDSIFMQKIVVDVASKLTKKDFEVYAKFYNEVKSLGANAYEERTEVLFGELKKHYKGDVNPPKPIGYRLPDVSK